MRGLLVLANAPLSKRLLPGPVLPDGVQHVAPPVRADLLDAKSQWSRRRSGVRLFFLAARVVMAQAVQRGPGSLASRRLQLFSSVSRCSGVSDLPCRDGNFAGQA